MGGKNDMQKKSVILTGTDHLEKAMFFKKQCLERAELEKCICKKLPSQIFRECRVLNEVDLPKDLEIIGNEAFFKCRQLEYIDLPIGLKKFLKRYGLDGVELMQMGKAKKQVLKKENVIGFHLMHYPCWYCLWKNDTRTLLEEFGNHICQEDYLEVKKAGVLPPVVLEEIKKNFGGTDREALLEPFRNNIQFAKQYDPEYVVFHVTDVLCCEAKKREFRYTDEEIVDGAAEFLNELFQEDLGFELLLENLWWPGLTMTRPEITRRLLDHIKYPRKGIMLDIGHLLHTDTSLQTEEEAVNYLREVLSRYEDLSIIRGVHYHQTLEGAFVEETKKHPKVVEGSYRDKCGDIMEYVYHLDHHNPFLNTEAAALIKELNPEWLVFEFLTESYEQQEKWLDAQKVYFE